MMRISIRFLVEFVPWQFIHIIKHDTGSDCYTIHWLLGNEYWDLKLFSKK
jgi:hypothetical protein